MERATLTTVEQTICRMKIAVIRDIVFFPPIRKESLRNRVLNHVPLASRLFARVSLLSYDFSALHLDLSLGSAIAGLCYVVCGGNSSVSGAGEAFGVVGGILFRLP